MLTCPKLVLVATRLNVNTFLLQPCIAKSVVYDGLGYEVAQRSPKNRAATALAQVKYTVSYMQFQARCSMQCCVPVSLACHHEHFVLYNHLGHLRSHVNYSSQSFTRRCQGLSAVTYHQALFDTLACPRTHD